MIESEAHIRLLAFISCLLLLAAAETLWPRRVVLRSGRWPTNLTLVILNTLLMRFTFPLLAVGWAIQVEANNWGLLALFTLPVLGKVLLAILLLDLIIYWQHRLFHRIPWLWRLHRLHHSDLDFDVTTGLRFHPGEIIVSMLIKLGAVTVLGAPAIAVLMFEIILSSSSLFEHANLRLPKPLDRMLRVLIVTPDMHRIHHSVLPAETNSNYGFSFSFWDRVFRSYRHSPRDGQLAMRIGLEQFRQPTDQRFDHLLLQPFKRNDATPNTKPV